MLMKKILLFASAALLFAGCAKENITPTENPDNNSQKGDITLRFSASQTGFGTKAVIGETTTDTEEPGPPQSTGNPPTRSASLTEQVPTVNSEPRTLAQKPQHPALSRVL